MDFLQRTKQLLDKKQMKKLQNSKICVVGCGGVGGYVIEMLARSGVKNLTIIDFDKIDITNINRQIIATTKTVGKYKVEEFEKRVKEINPKIKIVAINKMFCEQTKNEFKFNKLDYIVDAIDSVPNKLLLIETAKENNVQIISAMGVGNKIEIPNFQICDIFKTENDGLAKKMRKLLREHNIKKLDVCCSLNNSKANKTIGSIAYYPAMAGCLISSYVINQIIKEK